MAAQYGFVPAGLPASRTSRAADVKRKSPGRPAGPVLCGREEPVYLGPASRRRRLFARMHARSMGANKSVICLPLQFQGKTFQGRAQRLTTRSAAPPGRPRPSFNREDLELLNTMGAMISSSVENAHDLPGGGNGLANAGTKQLVTGPLRCLYEISGAMMTTDQDRTNSFGHHHHRSLVATSRSGLNSTGRMILLA